MRRPFSKWFNSLFDKPAFKPTSETFEIEARAPLPPAKKKKRYRRGYLARQKRRRSRIQVGAIHPDTFGTFMPVRRWAPAVRNVRPKLEDPTRPGWARKRDRRREEHPRGERGGSHASAV